MRKPAPSVLTIVALALAAAPARAQIGTRSPAPDNPYAPPPCVVAVPFADVTCTTPYDAWIEQFAADSITGGCGNGDYCPTANVTRNQMAVFVERAMRGTGTWSPGDLGNQNTGLGAGALMNNSAFAIQNTAVGTGALQTQSFANGDAAYDADNTAVGYLALNVNQPDGGSLGFDGTLNTAAGSQALAANTIGFQNTAVGAYTLTNNTTGRHVTAIGYLAGSGNTTGSDDTFVGMYTSALFDNVTDAMAIGANTQVDASYHVRIGDANVTQIGGNVAWSNLSDARAKKDIRPLDLGLDFVMALRPVSFRLIQGNGRTDMGFVAQDVEALLGDDYNLLGIGGDAARTLSLRYTDLIAPLVKAVQEQQATITAQQARIDTLEARLAAIETRLAGRRDR